MRYVIQNRHHLQKTLLISMAHPKSRRLRRSSLCVYVCVGVEKKTKCTLYNAHRGGTKIV